MKAAALNPALVQARVGKADDLRNKMPANRRLPRARAAAVLAALELTRGESPEQAVARRGLRAG